MNVPEENVTAKALVRRLNEARAMSSSSPGGVPKRDLFAWAKSARSLQLGEVEELLESDDHDARILAVSIMDWDARDRRTSDDRRQGFYDLYIRRHDRIDSWDLVDRAAPHVVGGWLVDKPRDPLYRLAESDHWYERRTAIVSTYFFIRRSDLFDTFAIGDILAHDAHHLVQKAVGGWVREAGKRSPDQLLAFLDRHASTMPRTALRYAIEHLAPQQRAHYLSLASTR